MARKARLEGEASDVAKAKHESLVEQISRVSFAANVADFRERFPEEWEALRLCPLQHGLETMIEKLNG